MITLSPTTIRTAAWLARYPSIAAATGRIVPALRRASSGLHLADVAEKSWELAPAESVLISPALYDEDDLTRVTGVDVDSTREIEWRRIRGGPLQYRPTVAYQLGNAVLSKGHLILPRFVRPVTTQPWPLWGRHTETETEPALLTATFNGSRYFGHWMMDELTRIVAAPRIGQPVAPPRPLSTHQRDYLKLLGLEQQERSDVLFRQLILFEERNQNAYRRERYALLRERARRSRHAAPCEGVMLLRGRTGVARVLLNEEDLADRLSRRGLRTMCPTEHSVTEILDACMDAKIVVGVEGSQMMHALLTMQYGGTLVTLQPPSRFNNILKTYCDALGLRYAFIVGQQRNDGFSVDQDHLNRLLDRLSAS